MQCDICGATQGLCYCKRKETRMCFCEIHMPNRNQFDLVYKMM